MLPNFTPEQADRYREATQRMYSILQSAQLQPDRWHRARAQMLADLADKPERMSAAKQVEFYERLLARFDKALTAKEKL